MRASLPFSLPRLGAALRPALWLWVTLAVLLLPNALLALTESLSPAGRAANVLLPGGLYMLLLACSRRAGRNIWLSLPLMFFAAFQLVLLWLYGRSVIAVDMFMNLWTTNSSEVGELLGQILPAVVGVVVLYGPPLVAGAVMWVRRVDLAAELRRRVLRAGAWVTVAGAAALGAAWAIGPHYSPLIDLYPLNIFNNIRLAAEAGGRIARYHDTSTGFSFGAVSERPADAREVYVLVVGETARADRWQLNGAPRATNPRLARVDSGLVSMSRVLSQSNTTHKSVPLLLTHLTAATYADSLHRVKSLITAFSEAGFATAFVSNQRRNGSYIDFFGREADTCLYLRQDGPSPRPDATDLDLLPVLDGLVSAGHHKLLVVLHTYGSHFSYSDRYAGVMTPVFTPDTYSEASADNRQALLNAYDNTVVLTDSLLHGVITRLDALGPDALAGMLYTSDHGEDIFDDGRSLFLHASPCPTLRQLHVPFIVYMGCGLRRAMAAEAAALAGRRHARAQSSAAFFDTALLLGGVATPYAAPSRSPLSPAYAEPDAWLYLNDHNEPVDLTGAGFRPLDFILLDGL